MSTGSMQRGRIFTAGYSTHHINVFIDMLTLHGVEIVCDVRSVPYSSMKPDYSRPQLKASLNASGIKYAFFGNELGARPKDRTVYVDGQARYDLIATRDFFLSGLDRVRTGAMTHKIALVCAERDPIDCHRSILVCHQLRDLHERISHIKADGDLESHRALGLRLVETLKMTPPPLTSTTIDWDEAISEAYRLQASRIAFTERPQAVEKTYKRA